MRSCYKLSSPFSWRAIFVLILKPEPGTLWTDRDGSSPGCPNAWSKSDVTAAAELQFAQGRPEHLQRSTVPQAASQEPNEKSEENESNGYQCAFAKGKTERGKPQ